MRKIETVERLEAIVGTPRPLILMKSIDALDDGCRSVLARAPVAWFGFRDQNGIPTTTLVGGFPGFVRILSPTRVSFDLHPGGRAPVPGGVSFIFLLPGIGETLRLNGTVARRSGTPVVVDVQEAFVHCARCILRSGIWNEQHRTGNPAPTSQQTAPGPLGDTAVAEFLAASPFVAVSSWGGDGAGDTSPKGDHPGFVRIVDPHTIAIPDRRGNQRTDTFHNVLSCDQVSLGAIVPGRTDLLHLNGTAYVTDEAELLQTMAVGGRPPAAALIVRVRQAALMTNEAVRTSRLWCTPSHVDRSAIPDLMRLSAQHLATNRARGTRSSAVRALSRVVAALPAKLLRRGIDHAYRKQLNDEGY